MAKIDFIPLTKDKYDVWDKFCMDSGEAWFWNTTKWLDYSVAYRPACESENLSFMVTDQTGIIAVCALILEKVPFEGKHIFQFSNSGLDGYIITPIVRNDIIGDSKRKILRIVFDKIDSMAKAKSVSRALFRTSPLGISGDRSNWFSRYQYLNASLDTQLIDISLPLECIWSDIRKGHKYDIKRGESYYKVNIWHSKNPDKVFFDLYRQLHHKAAGRVTRPLETFEMMYEWMTGGNGLLCGVSRDGKFVGFSYIILYKKSAYYLSASDDPDFKIDIPVYHIIQWSVIKWLKENGYSTYEIGTQQFGSQVYDITSEKDLNIAFFKRGFGGNSYPVFRGEKFYSKEYFLKIYSERVNQYAKKNWQ